MNNNLDFEKPIWELEKRIAELKEIVSKGSLDLSEEIKRLERELEHTKRKIYENLTAWQRVQIARHPKRPYTLDYLEMIATEFIELHGDRSFSDDKAIVAGLAKIDGQKLVVVGHQKGRDTKENLLRNFGCAHPEGYRKAIRAMKLAGKFDLPIVSFIDTPGAYPGIGAEERGQAGAIAYNLREMASLYVPILVLVIGEGGSGGALGIGLGDVICVMENAYYSVISPEGCAAILWKDKTKAPQAAEALKLTAKDLLSLGIIDEIISEPLGGAHKDPQRAASNLKASIKKNLKRLLSFSREELVKARYEKFRKIGMVG